MNIGSGDWIKCLGFVIIRILCYIWLQDIYKTNVLKSIDKIEQLCYNMGTKSRKEIEMFG